MNPTLHPSFEKRRGLAAAAAPKDGNRVLQTQTECCQIRALSPLLDGANVGYPVESPETAEHLAVNGLNGRDDGLRTVSTSCRQPVEVPLIFGAKGAAIDRSIKMGGCTCFKRFSKCQFEGGECVPLDGLSVSRVERR